jgi:predicted ArsR family transcriptional regulator
MSEESGETEREWTDDGKYAEMYSAEKVYELIQQAPRQVVTTADVTEAMGCTRATARRKLRDLAIEGKVEKRQPSGRIVLWYLTEDDTDATLKRLSNELGEAITVGDTIYEDGDKHPAEQSAES